MDDIQRSLVVCRECSTQRGTPHWIACGSKRDRDNVLASHESLGHTARTVRGWPTPRAAWDIAFGREKR